MNTCVCCGDEIPEGRQVCPNCESKFGMIKDSVHSTENSECTNAHWRPDNEQN